jgi:uncharacterized membrane protein YozB (DUF420 family)
MPSIILELPTLNALLNAMSALLLILARRAIKRGNAETHKQLMLRALIVSALFLISYLYYHSQVGTVHYPLADWTRTLYRAILFPHMILATVMVPFIIAAVWLGLKGRFQTHTRITKVLWPVWMFVSVTGILVYAILYLYAGAKAGG